MYSVCLDRIKLILLLPSLLQQYNLERQVYAVTTPELSNLCDHHLFRSYPRFASSRFSLTCSVNVSLIQIHSWFGTHSMAFTLFLNCFILEINILSWVCIAQRKGITVSGAHGKAICSGNASIHFTGNSCSTWIWGLQFDFLNNFTPLYSLDERSEVCTNSCLQNLLLISLKKKKKTTLQSHSLRGGRRIKTGVFFCPVFLKLKEWSKCWVIIVPDWFHLCTSMTLCFPY